MRISWTNSNSTYRMVEGDIDNVDQVPVGVYEVGCDMRGYYLTKTADSFTFNYKIYNLQRDFLDYVKTTFNNTKGNLGILFNGTRGTGKSVSAKVLANELKLPVIIVQPNPDDNCGLISYLASFNFDCILFFDEFEKKFSEKDCSILQIMDGVYTSDYRRVFLLTTNDLTINENLLSRPSRIRYIREFGNLPHEIVEEYLDDNLKVNDGRDDLINYIDSLTISTIDILKAITDEVNIHGVNKFLEIKKSFNVQTASYNYSAYRAYIEVSEQKEFQYTIEKFLKELESYKNRFTAEYQFKDNYELASTNEEKEKLRDEFYKSQKRKGSFSLDHFNDVEKAWNKYKPGDYFYNDRGEKVIKIDIKNKVVVTEYGDYMYFYYIENPDAKPSLYKNTNANNYGYIL